MNKLAILSIVAALATLCFIAYSPQTETAKYVEFQQFINEFGLNFASENEYEFRREVFMTNMEKAKKLAELNPQATFGVNKFSAMTDEEWMKTMGDNSFEQTTGTPSTHNNNAVSQNSIDWRSKFNPIQDQGNCGSCWAFAGAATAETYSSLFGYELLKYSEQELVDCVYDTDGCEGGLAMDVFSYYQGKKFCTNDEYRNYTASGASTGP